MKRTGNNSGHSMSRRKKGSEGVNVTSGASATLQIQELQNIMNLENDRIQMIKSTYTQQNIAIAKENSLLKIKLNEMETKVSELIQENIATRSQFSMSQLKYKEQLNERVTNLENDLLGRFQSILDLFQDVRSKEQLQLRTSQNGNILEKRLHPRDDVSILPCSSRPTSHSILQDECTNISPTSTSSSSNSNKKRRKSSRRQSMFVPSDFEFPDRDNENNKQNNEIDSLEVDDTHTITTASDDIVDDDEQYIDTNADFTNSIIDYSIPEELDNNHNITSHSINSNNNSSSKLEIFRDNLDTHTEEVKPKVKHTINPPRIKNKKKKIIDEIMPVCKSNTTQNLDITYPTRRTRGKTVDYKLPSLRAKMRRPSEKLVDATTTINIQDLQVSHKNKIIKKEETSNEIKLEIASEPKSNISEIKHKLVLSKKLPLSDVSTNKLNISNDKPVSSPLTEKDLNKKRKLFPKTKRKLFKHAIINDLNDENSENFDSSSSIIANRSNNKSVSFRLSDEDLSVFDLIGNNTLNNQNKKTYRNSNTNSSSLKGKVLKL